MQGNSGFEAVEEAYHAMSAEGAARYLAIGQYMAEQFPREIKLSLAQPLTDLRELQAIAVLGKMSPAGMLIVNWADRTIGWCNGTFAKYFNAVHPDAKCTESDIASMPMVDCVPGFAGSHLEGVYETVAQTLQPFRSDCYALDIPAYGMTYWDWSITPLPCSTEGVPLLLVQMHKLEAPRQQLAA